MAGGNTVFGFGFRIFAKNQFSAPVNQASQAANNLAKNVRNAGAAAKSAQPQMAQLQDGMSGAATATSKLGSMMRGLIAATVAYLSIRGLANIFKSLIQTGNEEEQQLLRLTSITGDAEKGMKAYEWAVRKAADTPFEIPEIVDAFTMLSAYGIDAVKNIDLVGNMAMAMGKPLEEAVYSITLAGQGMARSLRQSFGVNTAAMQDALKGLTPGTKAYQEAVLSFLGNIQRFQGGMERARTSLKVITSNIGDFWTRMKMALVGKPGQGLLADAWKNLMGGILGWLEKNEKHIKSIFEGIGKVLAHVIDMVSRVVQGAFGMIENWVKRTGNAFADQRRVILPFILFLELAFGKVKGFIDSFMDGWREGTKGVTALRNTIKGLFGDMEAPGSGGWNSFAEALGQVAAGFQAILIVFDLLKKAVEGWEWLFSMGGAVIDKAAQGVAAITDPYARKELFDEAKANINTVGQVLTGAEQRYTVPSTRTVDTANAGIGAVGNTSTVGDINVTVNTMPGQTVDSTQLANEIMRKAKEAAALNEQRSGKLGTRPNFQF